MYISRALTFRDLSKIAKLNTSEYQLFRDMICNSLGII